MTITPIALSLSPYSTPPQTSDPANFDPRADLLFGTELPRGVTEWNAITVAINVMIGQMNVDTADVTTKQGIASTAATNAATSEANALTYKNAAAASAAAALGAPGTNATSTTSRTLGTGANTITIQTGKLYIEGQTFSIAYASDPTKVMYATATAYNSGTGVLSYTVASTDHVKGSGTYADWKVALCALPGLTGPQGASGYVSMGRKSVTATGDYIGGTGSSGSYANDLGKVITASGFTADTTTTLDTAANCAANFFATLSNQSAYKWTISSASNIDGATTRILQPWEVVILQGNGSDFKMTTIVESPAFGADISPTVVQSGGAQNMEIAMEWLSATSVAVTTYVASTARVHIITKSGATISVSAGQTFPCTNGFPLMRRISSTSFWLFYFDNASSSYLHKCRLVTVSGGAPTLGTERTMTAISGYSCSYYDVWMVSATRFVWFHQYSAGIGYATYDISGDNISAVTNSPSWFSDPYGEQMVYPRVAAIDATSCWLSVSISSQQYDNVFQCALNAGTGVVTRNTNGMSQGSLGYISANNRWVRNPTSGINIRIAQGYSGGTSMALMYNNCFQEFAWANSRPQIVIKGRELALGNYFAMSNPWLLPSGRMVSMVQCEGSWQMSLHEKRAGLWKLRGAKLLSNQGTTSPASYGACCYFDDDYAVAVYTDSNNSNVPTAQLVDLGTMN